MLRLSTRCFATSNKKFLKLKCSDCTRLLPVANFNHSATVLHGVDRLVCLGCKKYCNHCGQLQPKSLFPDHDDPHIGRSAEGSTAALTSSLDLYGEVVPTRTRPSVQEEHRHNHDNDATESHGRDGGGDWCLHCIGKKHAAESNVFFRFPVLKYRASPFSVDRYREVLEEERRSGDTKHPQRRRPV